MKKLKVFFFVLVGFMTFISCDNHVEDEAIILSEDISDGAHSLYDNEFSAQISVTCQGNCEENGRCQVMTQLPPETFECSCSGCQMHIELTKQGSEMFGSNEEAMERIAKLDFPKHSLSSYLEKNYPTKKGGFTKIDFLFGQDYEAVLIEFNDHEGSKSLMYVNDFRSSNKFIIDCTGSCGCREVYDLNEGTASCSCDECKMVVEELTKAD